MSAIVYEFVPSVNTAPLVNRIPSALTFVLSSKVSGPV
jgi:hypothetical protein